MTAGRQANIDTTIGEQVAALPPAVPGVRRARPELH